MISFESVEVKNFMNYGNVPTALCLDSHRNTIITGKNGSGKSSILLDTICYVIFNKAYRSIKNSQLINSINGKACLVTTTFKKGSDTFKVSRGQKPSVFEIRKNDELIDEKALAGSYQEYLEDVIGMNFATFKQIVVIGSANYVPFMRLDTPSRRKIVESMLPVSIYSESGKIARERISEVKGKLSIIESNINSTKSSINRTKEILESINADDAIVEANNAAERSKITNDIEKQKIIRDELLTKTSDGSDVSAIVDKLRDAERRLDSLIAYTKSSLADVVKTRDFYEQDDCPTCNQKISDEMRQSMQSDADEKIDSLTKKIDEAKITRDAMILKLESASKKLADIQKANYEISTIDSNISRLNNAIAAIDSSKVVKQSDVKVKETLKTLNETLDDLLNQKTAGLTKLDALNRINDMFKDSGIKSMIVGEFIPLMNKKINEYLAKFDLFVDFELDGEFNETIKSRHRDAFSYNSFSEGEKQRIDLAILFAWRAISMQRNSASTNLIIFDETLDQSLDADAVDVFMSILEDIGDIIKVFVVSHKDMVPDLFDRWIKVEKKNDFGVLEIL